jgi:hypothetical protein
VPRDLAKRRQERNCVGFALGRRQGQEFLLDSRRPNLLAIIVIVIRRIILVGSSRRSWSPCCFDWSVIVAYFDTTQTYARISIPPFRRGRREKRGLCFFFFFFFFCSFRLYWEEYCRGQGYVGFGTTTTIRQNGRESRREAGDDRCKGILNDPSPASPIRS